MKWPIIRVLTTLVFAIVLSILAVELVCPASFPRHACSCGPACDCGPGCECE